MPNSPVTKTPAKETVKKNWTKLTKLNISLLRSLIERVAKCSFQLQNDPLDSAIFFLAKGVLCALFKSDKGTKMADFFKNDFNENKWQTLKEKLMF